VCRWRNTNTYGHSYSHGYSYSYSYSYSHSDCHFDGYSGADGKAYSVAEISPYTAPATVVSLETVL
jgi:hypothetical protein